MFVETKREGEANIDPLSLASFVSWLEIQPRNTRYDYCDSFDCALGRYLKTIGHEDFAIGKVEGFWPGVDTDFILQGSGEYEDWTYSHVIERARAALSGDYSK